MIEDNIIKGFYNGKEFNIELPLNTSKVTITLDGSIDVSLLPIDNAGVKLNTKLTGALVNAETAKIIKMLASFKNCSIPEIIKLIVDKCDNRDIIIDAKVEANEKIDMYTYQYQDCIQPVIDKTGASEQDIINYMVLYYIDKLNGAENSYVKRRIKLIREKISTVLLPYDAYVKMSALSKIKYLNKKAMLNEILESAMNSNNLDSYTKHEDGDYKGCAFNNGLLEDIKGQLKGLSRSDIVISAIIDYEKGLSKEEIEEYHDAIEDVKKEYKE